jgi:solute carrier family 35 protein F1/2
MWQYFKNRRQNYDAVQTRKAEHSLLFGQIVALIATSMNAASFTLEYGMNKVFPMFLMFHSYLLLSIHLFWSSNQSPPASENDTAPYRLFNIRLRAPWWYYLCLSILDVGPNYLALLAINRTSLTSATLLGSLTIPSTMFFCHLLLGKVYRPMHFVGVAFCMMGGTLTILMDKQSDSSEHPDSFWGDILCVLSALGYGIGDALAEFCTKVGNVYCPSP